MLIIAILGIGYFLLFPKYQTLKANKETLALKEKGVEVRESQLSDLEKLLENMRTEKNALAPLDEVIPTAPRVPELLANLDYLAMQSGLFLSAVNLTLAPTTPASASVQNPEAAESAKASLSARELGIMQVKISLRGEYKNFKTFLINLEQNRRLMNIEVIIVSPPGEESNIQEYDLTLQTYYQKK